MGETKASVCACETCRNAVCFVKESTYNGGCVTVTPVVHCEVLDWEFYKGEKVLECNRYEKERDYDYDDD